MHKHIDQAWLKAVFKFCSMGLMLSFSLLSVSACAQTFEFEEPVKPLKSQAMQANPDACVVASGQASSEGVDTQFAKKMAIRDALKAASLKNNVTVKTDQSVENQQLTKDSVRFTSQSKVKNYTILKEGLEEREDEYGQVKKGALNYQVTLKVCLTEEASACPNLPGNAYQTRVAIGPVVMVKANEANDISNLLFGFQQELDRRMAKQGYQNHVLFDEAVDLQPNVMVAPNLEPEQLNLIRDKTGAQFLLLTVIRSMSSHNEGSNTFNNVKRFYNYEVKNDSRYIEADWYVIDLMRYEIVSQSRGGFDVKGEVYVGRDRPFGTNAFFASDTGIAFHALLEQQTQQVLGFLQCQPLETQIIDVRDGEYIVYLNRASGVKEGDDLAVYNKVGRPVRVNGIDLGTDESPSGFIRIKRMMPKFAVAELTTQKGLVQNGDVVRAW
ncbi:hypothetical protein [Thiomicrorhabdus aquaedulcis]|uniref:hypothetical protein n=1 Tax=Thiomicrorhabdus aquaedulcis TaxID=2211106 RepID=UPI000FD70A08|nr:hypothetical protein [Thiomicrorhabdus aquaedulcis]